ncbi:MAG: hypothetical protein JW984_03620 [Deltaproteobacteria bacterium]|uniref:Uncharacterized protein n=1 Tax=Candidatus Zymogenus saltonus TaxID=2844893 RepID=A0A9D8PNN1_9DELT|nr:hypothetical protein [Candidatus Zymogenus saltonus]
MKTKKYAVTGIALFLAMTLVNLAFAGPLTTDDKEQVKWLLGSFASYVNNGNVPEVVKLFSKNMDPARKQAITDELYKKTGLRLEYFADLSDSSIEEVTPGVLYKVTGRFKAEGPNWNVSGLKATFTVERADDGYFYINDTDIFDKMGLKGVGKILGWIGGIFLVIFILFVAVVILIVVLIVRSQRKKKLVGTGGGPSTV